MVSAGRQPKKGTTEWLVAAEVRYGGYVANVPQRKGSPHDPSSAVEIKNGGMIGGDRMSREHHNYASIYSTYLRSFIQRRRRIVVAEVGILKGTGLAIWSDLFPDCRVIGFDIDLSYIEDNMDNLRIAGAFWSNSPELHTFDQLAYNGDIVRDALNGDKIDILIDDGHHSDDAVLNTAKHFVPFLSDDFVYFIEDNEYCFKQLKRDYPTLIVRNFGELTVVTRRESIISYTIWLSYFWRSRASKYAKRIVKRI
jgi:hypothetical protein